MTVTSNSDRADLASASKLQEGADALPKFLHQCLLTDLPQVASSLDAHAIQLIAHLVPHTCSNHSPQTETPLVH